MTHHDRLTERDADEIARLRVQTAADLSFNELIALAGQRLAAKADELNEKRIAFARRLDDLRVAGEGNVEDARVEGERLTDAGRDLSIAHTALEDAATRYNSACYRLAGTWKRADPDRAES